MVMALTRRMAWVIFMVISLRVNGPRPVVVRSPGDIRQSTDAFRRRVRCGSRRAARAGRGVVWDAARQVRLEFGGSGACALGRWPFAGASGVRFPLSAAPGRASPRGRGGAFHRCMAAGRIEWWRNASMNAVSPPPPPCMNVGLGESGARGGGRFPLHLRGGRSAVHRRCARSPISACPAGWPMAPERCFAVDAVAGRPLLWGDGGTRRGGYRRRLRHPFAETRRRWRRRDCGMHAWSGPCAAECGEGDSPVRRQRCGLALRDCAGAGGRSVPAGPSAR